MTRSRSSILLATALSLVIAVTATAREEPEDVFADPDRRDEQPALGEPKDGWSWRSETTIAGSQDTNYFQARAGAPKERVTSAILRHDLVVSQARRKGFSLRLRTEAEDVDDLGELARAAVRVAFERTEHAFFADLWGQWDRPAFRVAGALAESDSWGARLAWSHRPIDFVEWGLALEHVDEDIDVDPERGTTLDTVEIFARPWRDSRILSPEFIIERGWREGRDEAFDYERWRYGVKLVSSAVPRTYLSLLLRQGERDYTTGDPADGNLGREDRRRLARLIAVVKLNERLRLTALLSHEEGRSSRAFRDFDADSAWVGLTILTGQGG